MRRDTPGITARANPNNLYYCIKIIFVVFKAIGLAPLSITQTPSLRKMSTTDSRAALTSISFTCSRFDRLYNIVLIVVFVCLNIVTIPLAYNEDFLYKTKLTSIIELYLGICHNVVMLIVWTILCAKQNVMAKILHRLKNADDTIVYLSGGRRPETSWCYFLFLFLTSTAICAVMGVSYRLCYEDVTLDCIHEWFPAVIIHWFMIQYVSVVKYISNRFQALRRALLNRSKPSVGQTVRSPNVDEIFIVNDHYKKIISYRRAYTLLQEITWEISEFYSLPILLTVAVTCFSIVYNAYYLIVPFSINAESLMICSTVSVVFWLLGLCLPVIMLTVAVGGATTEMRKIADAAHKLLETSTTSPGDKTELQQFTLKLLQPNDQFTAYGLFPLNCTLLHSIFSMVVTYLIILCQLQTSDEMSDRPNSTQNNIA